VRWRSAAIGRKRPCGLVVTALLAGVAPEAFPQPTVPLDRAPPLPLDAPAIPLAGPVTVTRTGWGAFRRICVERFVARPDGGITPNRLPSCLRVEDARRDPAIPGWRLRIAPEAAQVAGLAFSALRTDDGRVGEVAIAALPAGANPPPEAQRQALLADLRAALNALGIPRRRLGQGDRFDVPLPTGMASQGVQFDHTALSCAVEGASRIAGRPVLVALCEGSVTGTLAERTSGGFRMAGRFAVDVETGLLAAQGYATLAEMMRTDPGGGPPRPVGTMLLLATLRME
jgi:hypothetical protein